MDYTDFELGRLLAFYEHEQDRFEEIIKNSPEGGLTKSIQYGKTRYIQCVPDGFHENGKHRYRKKIITRDEELIRGLVRKEYASSALRILDHNRRCIKAAEKKLIPYTFAQVRAGMHRAYLDFEEKIPSYMDGETGWRRELREWAEEPYEQSKYRPEEKVNITSRGLSVRTRAEVLIAEKLYEYRIPFRYEQVLWIGRYSLAPDFTFFDRMNREFYWEYCGMMDDPGYLRKQLWRRGVYESAGIVEWDNMIYTYDGGDSIDMREVEAVIQTKILPRL